MLSIDVYTCYATAGVGSLAGLGLIGMIRTDQQRLNYALGLFRWSLLSLAILLCVQVSPVDLRPKVLKMAIGFAGAGVAFLAWAFRHLNGRRTPPVLGTGLIIMVAVLLWGAGFLASDQTYVRTVAVVFCVVSLGMALDQGLLTFSAGKTHGGDLALLVAAGVFALNWVIMVGWTFMVPAPYPAHWLHIPQWLMPITGLSFALLPLVVASLVFANVNAGDQFIASELFLLARGQGRHRPLLKEHGLTRKALEPRSRRCAAARTSTTPKPKASARR
jgi:hypothetical protein